MKMDISLIDVATVARAYIKLIVCVRQRIKHGQKMVFFGCILDVFMVFLGSTNLWTRKMDAVNAKSHNSVYPKLNLHLLHKRLLPTYSHVIILEHIILPILWYLASVCTVQRLGYKIKSTSLFVVSN